MMWSRQPADIITEGKETSENTGAAGRVNVEVATDQSDRLSAVSVSAVAVTLLWCRLPAATAAASTHVLR